jgi:2-iminobutanoate/2-iminopropanoate deaminase
MATKKAGKAGGDGWERTRVGRKVHINTPPKTNANRNLGVPLCAAVKANGLIFCSGAVAFDPVKGGIQHGTMESETRVTLQNLKRILEANGSSLDKIVKVGVFIDTMIEFENMNRAYREFFPTNPPARTTVACELGWGVRVEIDCVALCDD